MVKSTKLFKTNKVSNSSFIQIFKGGHYEQKR